MKKIGGGLVMKRERTALVLKQADRAWKLRLDSFSTMESPEIWHLPGDILHGSREHAVGVFLAGYFSRSGKLADEVIPKAYRLLVDRPDLTDPRRMKKEFSQEDKKYLAGLIAFAESEPKRVEDYFRTLAILRDKYDGDPRNIFLTLGQTSDLMQAREKLIRRLEDFTGIGNKIAQLIIIWFQDVEWPEETSCSSHAEKWSWIRKIPAFPVDIWIMRLTRQFDLIVSFQSDHRDRVARHISEFFCQVCLEYDISWSMVSQAFWHAGARLCSQARTMSNWRMSIYCKTRCPFYDFCVGVMLSDADLRGRGRLGWTTHFEIHERDFPQPEMPGLELPENDGTVRIRPKEPRREQKLKVEEATPPLFELIDE